MAIYIEALGSITVLISACVTVAVLVWHFRLLRREEPGLPITDPFGAMNGAFVVLSVGVFVMSVYTRGMEKHEIRTAECRGGTPLRNSVGARL